MPALEPLLPAVAGSWCIDGATDEPRSCAESEQRCSPDDSHPSLALDLHACQQPGVEWTCPPGFVEVASDEPISSCAPDPSDCAEAFGGVEEKPGVLFVDAAAPTGGDGSRAAPFQSLDDALAVVPEYGTIALESGTYPIALDAVRTLAIRGRCAAQVTLTNAGVGPLIETISPWGKGELRLEGLTLDGQHGAIHSRQPPLVRLQRVLLEESTGTTVLVEEKGSVVTEQTVLIGTELPVGNPQLAVWARNGGLLTLLESRVTRVRGWGIVAAGKGTNLEARGLLVDSVRSDGTQSSGRGIQASYDAEVLLTGVRISSCMDTGLSVTDGATAQANGLRVDRTVPGLAFPKQGVGVAVILGGALQVRHSFIEHNADADFVTQGASSTLTAKDVLVSGPGHGERPHVGVGVQLGATMTLDRVRITGAALAGVEVLGKGTNFTALDLLVDDTGWKFDVPDHEPNAILVDKGARATLERTRISGGRTFGLVGSQASEIIATGVLVDGLEPVPGGVTVGIQVESGAILTIDGARLSGVMGGGLGVVDATLDAKHLLVDGTLGSSDEEGGLGIVAKGPGSRVSVSDARVTGSANFGIGVIDGSIVNVTDVIVDRSAPATSGVDSGIGIIALNGADLNLTRVRISKSRSRGLVGGPHTSIRARDLTVDGTDDDLSAAGYCVHSAGRLVLSRARLSGCRLAGLVALGEESDVEATDLLADAILKGRDYAHGFAVWATAGATVRLAGARLTACRVAGVLADGAGTHVEMRGVLVDETSPNTTSSDYLGIGVGAHAEGFLSFDSSLLDRNHSAGALFLYAGRGSVTGSSIVSTGVGDFPLDELVPLADGIVLANAGVVSIDATSCAANGRAAVHVSGAQQVSVERTLGTGSVYGMAVTGAPVDETGNAWFGNSLQNRSSKELSVPAPPPLATVPPIPETL